MHNKGYLGPNQTVRALLTRAIERHEDATRWKNSCESGEIS